MQIPAPHPQRLIPSRVWPRNMQESKRIIWVQVTEIQLKLALAKLRISFLMKHKNPEFEKLQG